MWIQYKCGDSRCMVNTRTGHITVYRGKFDRVDTHVSTRLRAWTKPEDVEIILTARRIVGGYNG